MIDNRTVSKAMTIKLDCEYPDCLLYTSDNPQRYNIFRNSFLNVNGMEVSQAGYLCMEDRVRGLHAESYPDMFNT